MSVWGGGGESRRVGTTNTVPMAFRVKDASFLFNKGAGRTERELNLRCAACTGIDESIGVSKVDDNK